MKLCRNKQTGVIFVCDGFIENLPYMEIIEGDGGESKLVAKKSVKVKSVEITEREEKGIKG